MVSGPSCGVCRGGMVRYRIPDGDFSWVCHSCASPDYIAQIKGEGWIIAPRFSERQSAAPAEAPTGFSAHRPSLGMMVSSTTPPPAAPAGQKAPRTSPTRETAGSPAKDKASAERGGQRSSKRRAPEIDPVAKVCDDAGVSEGIREFPFRGLQGYRRWKFDMAWPDRMIAFEYEGASWSGGRHTSGKGYSNDAEKYSEAAIAGWTVVRATADLVRNGKASELLAAALRKEG